MKNSSLMLKKSPLTKAIMLLKIDIQKFASFVKNTPLIVTNSVISYYT